jgi:hypothetical protein
MLAMPRLEEATTISPGQSSGAIAEERHPGYMFSECHVRPVRTTTYSLLYAAAHTGRWIGACVVTQGAALG